MLGLDATDKKILKIIGENPSYPSEIARETFIWRTTIQYRLKRLEKLGLAEKNKKGIKSVWERIYPKNWNKNIFKVYEGNDMLDAYNHLLFLPKETVVLCVQGAGAPMKEFSGLPYSFFQEAHRVFKKKRIILKGIVNKKVLDVFNKLDNRLIKSHIGRSLGIKLTIQDKLLLGAGEIMASSGLVLLANPEAKRTIVIKDKNIAKIIYETLEILFDAFKEKGSFDLNQYLKELINKK